MSGKILDFFSAFRTFSMHGNQEAELVKAARKLAIKDRSFAENLVFDEGLRGEITAESLRNLGATTSTFNHNGRLTMRGRAEIGKQMWLCKLPHNASWEEILTAPIKRFRKSETKI